jgi:hypothetical protein
MVRTCIKIVMIMLLFVVRTLGSFAVTASLFLVVFIALVCHFSPMERGIH